MTPTVPPEPAAGPLIIVSGPSGTGKSSLIHRLLAAGRWKLRHAVSATTRSPRPGEVDGRDYYFWDRPRFEEALARGEFLESALVHGNYYGTLVREVVPWRHQGWGVVIDIDVQGARQIWDKVADHVSVFVRTPSLAAYEQRLRARGTESDAEVARRLAGARAELEQADAYPYHIINDDFDTAATALADLVDRSFGRGGSNAG
jgi:guanylate kinase